MSDLGKARKRLAGMGRAAAAKRPRLWQGPTVEDDFMVRIQLALGLSPRQLAKALDVPLYDILDRHGPRANASSFVIDPFWQTLLDYVNNNLAGYLAIKEELERKQRLDQREHHERKQKTLGER
jgi:hypothetical protein